MRIRILNGREDLLRYVEDDSVGEIDQKSLDRYLKIVPAHSFGLGEKELLPNEELKKFLGY